MRELQCALIAILGLMEWYAVHQQEKSFDMFLGNTCSIQIIVNILAHKHAKKEEWDTFESSSVLNFYLPSRKWQKYFFFLLFSCPQWAEAVISKSRNGEIQNLPPSFLANEGVDA